MNGQLKDHPEELLPWVANDSLEGEERRVVETHLASCLACRRELDRLRELRREVQQVSAITPPGDAGLEHLMRQVAASETPFAQERQSGTASAHGSWPPWLGVAASLVVVVGIGWWTLTEAPAPPELRAEDETLVRSLIPPDEALPRESFILRWRSEAAPQGARFDVRVRTKKLEPVAEAQGLEAPEYQVPAANLADLLPGARLYWQVEVVFPDGVQQRSETFRVRLE